MPGLSLRSSFWVLVELLEEGAIEGHRTPWSLFLLRFM
jgi:hypothetical protein